MLNTVILGSHRFILHISSKKSSLKTTTEIDREKSHHNLPLQDGKKISTAYLCLKNVPSVLSDFLFTAGTAHYASSLKHLSIPQAAGKRLQFIGELWLEGFSRDAHILQPRLQMLLEQIHFCLAAILKSDA